jgi:AraC-like DNA-binding protein
MTVAKISGNIARSVRDQRCIAADPGHHCFLIRQISGQARMTQAGKSHELVPGEFILIDSRQPARFDFMPGGFCQYSYHIPVSYFEKGRGARPWAGTYFPKGHVLSDELNLLLQNSAGNVSTVDGIWELMEQFATRGEGAGSGLSAVRSRQDRLVRRAKAYMCERYCDPNLTVGEMALSLGTTVRQIQRAFHTIGTTPIQVLIDLRLEQAKMRLGNSEWFDDPDSIVDIAFDSGFNDLSYFYRMFRQKYGISPGRSRPVRVSLQGSSQAKSFS